MNNLADIIQDNYFQGYAYSYPHKSTYRPLAQPLSLQSLWEKEEKSRLFLYVHIPFCEMRCGFCNLFTMANPADEFESPYISALQRQAQQVKAALGPSSFSRIAIGGGTPTFMRLQDLEKLFKMINEVMGADSRAIPCSVEMSPKTATPEKLALLFEYGSTRASIGVQSFLLEETKSLGRPQKNEEVRQALQWIQDSGIPEMNIDLIYGSAGQSIESWQYSLEQALDFSPTEVFLYPLYVRPLTGLGLKEREWNDHRLALYRFGRDWLLQHGYEQRSMRMFRKIGAPLIQGPAYYSPEDGMLGLGVGARSYTHNFHYSTDYAVSRTGVKQIIQDYNHWSDQQFSEANYGIFLDKAEQKRRYIIKSLLEGFFLDFQRYQAFFGSDALSDFPQLDMLYQMNLTTADSDRIQLNQKGLELSDVIGPWLYSDAMRAKMDAFELV